MYRALNILGLYARVIFYPLGKDAPWGFTRISGSQNDSNVEKPFVAVNAFESYLVTYEKLEALLELCGLKPDDLGISPPFFFQMLLPTRNMPRSGNSNSNSNGSQAQNDHRKGTPSFFFQQL